jgi:hypothetical protein
MRKEFNIVTEKISAPPPEPSIIVISGDGDVSTIMTWDALWEAILLYRI